MKTEPLEHNIYFVIQPLHLLSRVLGLSPFHIDPNYTFRNKGGSSYCHITQATLLILLLLYGLYNSMLVIVEYSEPVFKASVRVVWAINIFVTHLTSILALLFTVTRNKNHMTNVLSLFSSVDNMLFPKNSKQSAYAQHRSHVMVQLCIMIILFGVACASCAYSYSDGTWLCYIYIASQILSTAINTVMILQYVSIVLMVKQRYQLIKHKLSEAASTDDVSRLRHIYVRGLMSYNDQKLFSIVAYNLKSDEESYNLHKIYHFRLIYSELYDLLHANNKSYEVLILLDVTARLTFIVPAVYLGVMTIQGAIFENGPFQVYFKGVYILSYCAFMVLTLLRLTFCCHKTTEEVHDILVCIQRLLLYPNALGWSTSDLKIFASQMKNSKVEFNICGFFALNLQFFCASMSLILTYLLVLNQFSQGV
jgi:hypothetical protein